MAKTRIEERPDTEEWLERDASWHSQDEAQEHTHTFSVRGGPSLIDEANITIYASNSAQAWRASGHLTGEWYQHAWINAELAQKFHRLVEQWRQETMHLSSYTDKLTHIAYYQIIGMGPAAVPLILRELQQRGGHWFLALTAITCEDPIRAEDAGNVQKMRQAWLEWGKRRGLIEG